MYAKHCNLVDADASGAESSRKHLESRLEVSQRHAFWIFKIRLGAAYYCIIMWTLESEISKERSEPFSRTQLRIFAQAVYF